MFKGHISARLDNYSSSYKTTEQNSSVMRKGAQLHLIVQIPVLNIKNESENSRIVLRQKEYIYCLRRNLKSPHVSLLRSSFEIVNHKTRQL